MKNCLLVIRNNKLVFGGEETQKITEVLSSCGYFFDRILCVGFSCGEEIVSALKECAKIYDNSVIVCPSVMKQTVCDFAAKQYGKGFDSFGTLNAGGKAAYLLVSDAKCELTPEKILDSFNARYGCEKQTMYIRTVGASPEEIETALKEAAAVGGGIGFRVYGSYGENTIELIYTDKTTKTAVDGALRAIATRLDSYIYALENVTLAERLFQLLKLRRMKICVAESFTGGGICKRLVEVSGISEVFFEGLNTYSNESKQARLGVKDLTLKQYGAVSEQTACEMAQGLIDGGNCDVAIATTGIAGPKSDNTQKPIGLCYIAIGLKESVSVYKFQLSGDRKTITETAINQALFLAYKSLK